MRSIAAKGLPIVRIDRGGLRLRRLGKLVSCFTNKRVLCRARRLAERCCRGLLSEVGGERKFCTSGDIRCSLAKLRGLIRRILPLTPRRAPLRRVKRVRCASGGASPTCRTGEGSLRTSKCSVLPSAAGRSKVRVRFRTAINTSTGNAVGTRACSPRTKGCDVFS